MVALPRYSFFQLVTFPGFVSACSVSLNEHPQVQRHGNEGESVSMLGSSRSVPDEGSISGLFTITSLREKWSVTYDTLLRDFWHEQQPERVSFARMS